MSFKYIVRYVLHKMQAQIENYVRRITCISFQTTFNVSVYPANYLHIYNPNNFDNYSVEVLQLNNRNAILKCKRHFWVRCIT